MKSIPLLLPLLAALPFTASAEDEGWSGTGEFGLALTRGNSHSENLNAKLALENESDDWLHKYGLTAVRSESEVVGDFDGDGEVERRSELGANRYALNASSGYKMNARASWIGALRYENDDFAAYRDQVTFSIGFGYQLVDTERNELSVELGPGFRRARPQDGGDAENDLIFRSLVDYRYNLTANTALTNTLLVEAGDDNRFAQNDFGIAVAMNDRFALKTGVQVRYNSEVEPGTKNTDTLTTVNLVYSLR